MKHVYFKMLGSMRGSRSPVARIEDYAVASGEHAAPDNKGRMQMVGWVKPPGGGRWHRYTSPVTARLHHANFWMIRVHHYVVTPKPHKSRYTDVRVIARDLVDAVGTAVAHVSNHIGPGVRGFKIGDAEMLSCAESLCCMKEGE